MTELLSKWVSNNKKLNHEERATLRNFVSRFKSNRNLQRVCIEDPDYPLYYNFSIDLSSFTSVDLLSGKDAGQITLKSSDECVMVIDGEVSGYDVDYGIINTPQMSASQEKETIVTGRFVVTKIEKVESPICKWDTLKVYTIKQIG